jgi:WD40 repeat protein
MRTFALLCLGVLASTSAPAYAGGFAKDKLLPSKAGETVVLAFSPDGKLLAAGHENGPIDLWSIPDGAPIGTLDGHREAVRSLAFSPDGATLTSASVDESCVKIWSLAEKTLLKTVPFPEKGSRVALGPGAKFAVTANDKSVTLVSLPDGKRIRTFAAHKDDVGRLAVSPDGKYLASSSDDGDRVVKLWALPAAELVKTLVGHEGRVEALAFSADGSLLASAGGDDDDLWVILWSVADGEPLDSVMNTEPAIAIAFSPDGKLVVFSGSEGKKIRVWSVERGKLLPSLSGLAKSPLSLVFSPDATLLASGGSDGSVVLWLAK